jgi:hypothetical protein
MVKISDSNPKTTSGNYIRLFGDSGLGNLITKIQSVIISTGNTLEKEIFKRCKKGAIIENCDEFLKNYSDDRVYLLGYRIFLKKELKNQKY